MLQIEPEERVTIDDILSHPLLKKYSCQNEFQDWKPKIEVDDDKPCKL